MSDIYGGIKYESSAKKVLQQVIKKDLTYIKIPNSVVEISGGTTLNSAFFQCRNSISTVVFEEGSQFSVIPDYVFSETSVQTVDFTQCTLLKSISTSAFRNCAKLSTVNLPPNVEILYPGVFSYSSLERITIPDSVREMKYSDQSGGTFHHCFNLSEVIFGEESQLEILSHHVFAVTSLTSFKIGKNLKSIGSGVFIESKVSKFEVHPDNNFFSTDGSFLYSKDKKSIIMPVPITSGSYTIHENVETMADQCFVGTGFTEIILPKSHPIKLSILGFTGIKCKTIVLREGTDIIPEACFRYSYLEYIDLPDSIREIRWDAFCNSSRLSRIKFPANIKTIGDTAFQVCTELRNVVIPRSVTSYGKGVFAGCGKNLNVTYENTEMFRVIDSMVIVNNAYLGDFIGKDETKSIVIPSLVTSISDELFKSSYVNSVSFDNPTSLQIGTRAFKNSKIKKITLPATLTSIGIECFLESSIETVEWDGAPIISTSCFYKCTSLATITFTANKITNIEKNAFRNTPLLSNINLENQPVESIGANCFQESGIQSVFIPSATTFIDEKAFYKSKVETVTIFGNVNVSKFCFSSCEKLKNVDLGKNVQLLDINSFSSCPELETLTLSPATKEVQSSAFSNCTKLKSITIPNNSQLKRIYPFVFEGCNVMTNLVVLDTEKFVFDESCLMNAQKTNIIFYLPVSRLPLFVVPGTVQCIDPYAFSYCTKLREIIIPDGILKKIGVNAFEYCTGLKRIVLPKSLDVIDADAFIGCNKFKCGGVIMANNESIMEQAVAAGIPRNCLSEHCFVRRDYVHFGYFSNSHYCRTHNLFTHTLAMILISSFL